MKSFSARRYDTLQPVRVHVGKLGRVDSVEALHDSIELVDGDSSLPLLAPGLFDLQVNGYGGCEFSSPQLTIPDVREIAAVMATQGVVKFLPTITTAPIDVMEHALTMVAVAASPDSAKSPEPSRKSNGAQIAGIHLEGPFLCSEDGPRGAHLKEHCLEPSLSLFQRLQRAAAGQIRLLTMAVEFPNAAEFIRQVTATGVTVAIGHTAATDAQIQAAVAAGAKLSTHLGNGAHAVLPRHPNYIWSQLADDRLSASLIADDFHLPAGVLKTIIRAKTPARCLLVSDMSGYAGKPPGRYITGLGEIEVLECGKIITADQETLLAAASMPLTAGIANVAKFGDVPRAIAIEMASTHAAQCLGSQSAFLQHGASADFTLLDWSDDSVEEIAVRGTMIGGDIVFGHFD
ncbi:MAG: amidohydrolase family protein [Pirellulales bacterium]|nr:amidohydrolase family protein [Pirellulales bacterium]